MEWPLFAIIIGIAVAVLITSTQLSNHIEDHKRGKKWR